MYPVNPVILSKNQIDENHGIECGFRGLRGSTQILISVKIRLIRVIRVRFKLNLENMGWKNDNN
jgi:hypothetical protein